MLDPLQIILTLLGVEILVTFLNSLVVQDYTPCGLVEFAMCCRTSVSLSSSLLFLKCIPRRLAHSIGIVSVTWRKRIFINFNLSSCHDKFVAKFRTGII